MRHSMTHTVALLREEALLKKEALMRCATENKALLECYKNASIFNLCTAENGAFWACYKRERVPRRADHIDATTTLTLLPRCARKS